MNILSSLTNEFQSVFGTAEQIRYFFAPGRINLIGEHTDYNGGHVFPASISLGTYAAVSKRSDKQLNFYSLNFPEDGIISCSISELSYNSSHRWANYPKGMIKCLKDAGYPIDMGMDILYYGNIPNGAGLSSSASIEIATGILLEKLFDLCIERIELVQFGKMAENQYIGVNSGIMDQFAIGMGKENHAILLNCDTLEYQYAPIRLEDHAIIIINTNKQRTLAGSAYNERRIQCEAALADLQKELPIDTLGEATMEQFNQYNYLIQDEINRKRAKHAISENIRTIQALDKLQKNDFAAFGKLMNDSHTSLQTDYEVTGPELDTIVHTAWETDGVAGARMTGAGFGGCAIALIKKEKIEAFKQKINAVYRNTTGYDASFYLAEIGASAKEITKGVL